MISVVAETDVVEHFAAHGWALTDPLDADTDDGGVDDGSEDTDLDGVVDDGETDPTTGHGDSS